MGVPVATYVHLVGAGVAGVLVVCLLLARRRSALPVGYLVLGTVGLIPWCLSVASALAEGLHPWHQTLWMPAVAWTAGALLLWVRSFARYGWQPSRPLVWLCLGVPVVLLVARVLGGTASRAPIFVFNTFYAFLLLLVIAATAASRSKDPDPDVRAVVGFVIVGSLGALVAEALRVQFTDLAALIGLTGVTVAVLRAGPGALARPEADTLIDDLGALVLVFDENQRLVDLNAPARLFYSVRGAEPPVVGTAADGLLGGDLESFDTLTVELAAGEDRVGMAGYAQRLPHAGTPSRGWVVLLRRATQRAGLDRRSARRAALRLVQPVDPDEPGRA